MRAQRTRALESGFTLLELMVVVALVGILSSIAISKYNKFAAVARQTEAKIALGSIYTIETSFAAVATSFSPCLNQLGYAPVSAAKRYYLTGFFDPGADPSDCGINGTSTCHAYDWNTTGATLTCQCECNPALNFHNDCVFWATTSANKGAPPITSCAGPSSGNGYNAGMTNTWLPHKSSFTAGAYGNIGTDVTTYDAWTINQNKQLLHIKSGI